MRKETWRLLTYLALAILLAFGMLLAGRLLRTPAFHDVVLFEIDRAAILCWAALILVAATGFGAMLLRRLRLRPTGHMATALFGAGIGLGAISLLTLFFGVLGFLGKVQIVVMLLVLLGLGLSDLGTLLRMAGVALNRKRLGGFAVAVWVIMFFFLLLNITRAFEPPFEYDALEYHLLTPAAYSKAGRAFFISDNAYANFPRNTEMLYLAAFELTETPERGVQLGQLLSAMTAFLAALALREMLRGVSGKRTGDIAAAIFYVWPTITVYSGTPFVELPLMFYTALALWGLLWSWRRKREKPGARGWVILSAIATGLALDVKYTAALFLFVPIPLWILLLGLRQRLHIKEIILRGVIFAAIALLCFSPWLINNYVNTRNPVYPLLYKVFGSTNWDAQKDARWTQAHSPKDLSFARMRDLAYEALFVNDNKVSFMAIFFAPLVLLARRREREVALWLLITLLLFFVLWFYFTQQNIRFLEVAMVVLAAFSAIGAGRAADIGGAPLRVAIVVLLVCAPTQWSNYLNVQRSLSVALGNETRDEYFAKTAPDFRAGYQGMMFLNSLPASSKTLFIGEARTFYCERDFVAPTVFDSNPLAEIFAGANSADEVAQRMKERGITHIYVDTFELSRLQRSYSYQYDGRTWLGMLDGFNWDLFDQFIRGRTRLVWSLPQQGVDRFPWAQWPQILTMGNNFPSVIAVYEVQ